MKIFVHNKGQNLGPYTDDEVRSLMSSGKFPGTTPAWSDKGKAWKPLGELLHETSSQIPVSFSRTSHKAIAKTASQHLIHVDGQNFGPYSEDEIRGFLNTGKYKSNDLAWSEESKSWVTLTELVRTGAPQSGSKVFADRPATAGPMPASKNIMINSGGQNYGPYTGDQVREFLRWGIFQMNDFAWSEASNAWLSVVELLNGTPPTQQSIPAPVAVGMPMMAGMPMAMVPYTPGYAVPQMTPMAQMVPQYQSAYSSLNRLPRPRKGRSIDPSKAKIIVISGGQKFGPFGPGPAQEFLRVGKFHENDFAWSDMHNCWLTLGEVLDELRPYARRKNGGVPASIESRRPNAPVADLASQVPAVSLPHAHASAHYPMGSMPSMGNAPRGGMINPIQESILQPGEKMQKAPRRRVSGEMVMAATFKHVGCSF